MERKRIIGLLRDAADSVEEKKPQHVNLIAGLRAFADELEAVGDG